MQVSFGHQVFLLKVHMDPPSLFPEPDKTESNPVQTDPWRDVEDEPDYLSNITFLEPPDPASLGLVPAEELLENAGPVAALAEQLETRTLEDVQNRALEIIAAMGFTPIETDLWEELQAKNPIRVCPRCERQFLRTHPRQKWCTKECGYRAKK